MLERSWFSHVALIGRGCKLDPTLRVYYHFEGRVVTARVTSGWVCSDWDCSRRLERVCEELLELMSYKDPTPPECIPSKLLVNPNIWHVKVSLVVYATMEMHESNRGRLNENWIRFHAEYINMWNNRYELLPHREAIIALELACDLEYMPWFRLLGKPYLQMGPSSVPTQELTPIPTPLPGQYVSCYSSAYANPITFT
ncbi:hypothetical protein Goari_004560 [Gossypium aridum]|uniref:Aminotransferase-like plant mobile domain-containing protein n=1 Tax=Gossypium aridum TaxID=34290 RepID=A0A7J8Y5B1_GOSAI|nr:hypothetical protein [Gossypium aridum]